jgi:hypothetical protein
MKFNSKAHMTRALIEGKRFRLSTGSVVYYDERFANPFRFGDTGMGVLWELYDKDVWTEVTPVHTHQALIDAYHEGQAWQCTVPAMYGAYADCVSNGAWVEPSWDERITYRLHPHDTLIQAHNAGAKIQAFVHALGAWVEQANPDWDTDVQYRAKPVTKVVHEWMCKPKLGHTWELEELLLSEEEAKEYYLNGHDYQKTGRSWEVEA